MTDVVTEQPPTEAPEVTADSHARSHCGCESKHSQKHTHKPQADTSTPAEAPHPSPSETVPDTTESQTEVVVHKDHHDHDHSHDHDHEHDHAHQGQAIQYREAPPQFGLATHVDDIIHTEFRYVSGFKPFQFHAPGSCLEPLAGEKQASK
ncbi:hypothetical protein COEREDRAFT_82704 [Coemansia reversa NRRL 1564]|uniref:Uncharacterized protein n=1 Tax=Coemansia reversa (strain ATCC 12441 / NRRL 1564) TaxID=763665 RepID=A0A2G5B5Y8_COERN|nr:hypothetical protein COEREDRAFT_82704 [Coemansia reversa NRRL 1564]|eukprot:PIA14414.1 hypothetical protein COEREDRAFT_82704 [Coemansia reversa NRRL 1564]